MEKVKNRTIRGNSWKEWILSDSEWPYMAGLLDGEGHVTIAGQKKAGKVPWYHLNVGIGNTHQGVMQWVQDKFGGTLRAEKYPNARTVYKWVITGDRAAFLLIKLLPYLKIKKKQAELGIYYQKHKENKLTEEEIEWRELMKLKIYVLNGNNIHKKKELLRGLQRLNDETSHLKKLWWDEATV